jgi:hypothetical protein
MQKMRLGKDRPFCHLLVSARIPVQLWSGARCWLDFISKKQMFFYPSQLFDGLRKSFVFV